MDKAWVVRGKHTEQKNEAARKLRHEMTGAESVLWEHLRRNQLGGLHFRRQQVIDGYIADFYCHAANLVIEVDGSVHDGREIEDRERTRAIGTRGPRVIRFTNDQVLTEVTTVLAAILDAAKNTEASH